MKECRTCKHCYEDGIDYCPDDEQALVCPFEGSAILDNKYLLERSLGSGGMGAVYLARHVALQKVFAVKLIKPQGSRNIQFLPRFRIEAEALGKLNHPYIVQVTDYGIDPRKGGIPYLVMEYLEGFSLLEKIQREGPLDFEKALPVFNSIAQGLDHAHDCGILHRDLKPANVFLVKSPLSESQNVKVFDFGLARFLDPQDPFPQELLIKNGTQGKRPSDDDTQCMQTDNATKAGTLRRKADAETIEVAVDSRKINESDITQEGKTAERLTMPGTFMGTLMYMAPEIIRMQDATRASDIYSFGILIYETLVGRPPFIDSFNELKNLHLNEKPPLPSSYNAGIPEELNQAILSPLAKDPSLRPHNAREVVKQLTKAYYRSKVRQWKTKEFPRRMRIAVALALLLALFFWGTSKISPFILWEEKLTDARFYFASVHSPHPDIMLLSLDNATLEVDSTPLMQKADEMGSTLQDVFNAGARGIGIDILLPAQWSHSQAFSKLILRHSNQIVLAALSAQDNTVAGPEALDTLTVAALGSDQTSRLFGFVNIKEDADGIIRQAHLIYKDQENKARNSFAMQFVRNAGYLPMAHLNQTQIWIDYSIDWLKMRKISWKDVSGIVKQNPDAFRNKLVLVGGEYAGSGDEYYRIPYARSAPGETSGLLLQALIINTLLQGERIQSIGEAWSFIAVVVFIELSAFALLFFKEKALIVALISSTCIMYVIASFLIFDWSHWLLPISAPVASIILSAIVALWIRKKLPSFPNAML